MSIHLNFETFFCWSELIDLDHDGFVNVEDLYLFFVSQTMKRGVSDPSSAILGKPHFSGKDVCASAQEVSWEQGFDPIYTLLFYLYH